jgi:hypothetical protein
MYHAVKITSVMLVAMFFMSANVQAADAHMVDIAGSQRMLTQRILNTYCQIGLDEIFGNPQKQLREAINRYERQIAIVERGSNDTKVTEKLSVVKNLWPKYKSLATSSPNKEGAAKLLKLNPELLAASHAVVLALEEANGTKAGEIVNLAGRQRMLSQRMAMFYMLKIWGVDDPSIEPELEKAKKEIIEANKHLSSQTYNTLRINSRLRKVKNSMSLLERTMEYKRHNLSFTVATTTERMLDAMNDVTEEYVALLGSGSQE